MRVSFTRGRPAALAERALVAVDRLPAVVGDELGLALAQQALDTPPGAGAGGCSAVDGRRCREARSASIASTVSWASFLFVPITPEGPRLIQPTTYSPGERLAAVGVEHAPALVGDHRRALVEGDARQRDAAVADRAKHEPGGDPSRARSVGSRAQRAARRADELVADELDGAEAAVRVRLERGGREQEAQHDPLAAARGRRARRSRAGSRRCAGW